jgi:deoxyguanosine kinase
MNYYLVVEGVIGVGKTTLARYLQQHLEGATLILERFDENPFLSNFYQDRDAFGFQTQIFFLLSRYQQQQALHHQPRPIITDYLFAKDHLFAQLNLHGDELATYEGLYRALAEKIAQPDLVVYLKANPDTLLQRIAMRDRPYERDMDAAYIKNLCAAYDNFFAHYTDHPLLVIPADDIDFVASESHRYHLLETILARLTDKISPPNSAPIELKGDHHFDPACVPLDASPRRLPAFQEFHRFLDAEKGFNTDLLLNMVKLQEEVGELARAVTHHWQGVQHGQNDAAHDELRNELADVLAYLLKLANYTGVDLEAAYLSKMAKNRTRVWKSPEGN